MSFHPPRCIHEDDRSGTRVIAYLVEAASVRKTRLWSELVRSSILDEATIEMGAAE